MPRKPNPVAALIRGRLRLSFRSTKSADDAAPALPPPPRVEPEIEVVAYAEDCILSGHLRLSTDRLSDLLIEHMDYAFVDVLVEELAGGHAIEVHEMLVNRDEILLVQASGPRGNAQRRQRTRQHPIVAKSGPYEVRGYVHALPGTDPIASVRRRKPMVALTEAVISYAVESVHHERRASVVILNRECVDWIAAGEDEEVRLIDVPVEMGGPLVKDFTGELLA